MQLNDIIQNWEGGFEGPKRTHVTNNNANKRRMIYCKNDDALLYTIF